MAACSGAPRPTGSRTAEVEGGRVSVTVVAEDTAFDIAELRLPADTSVDLTLDNRDSAVHNLTVYAEPDRPAGEQLFVFEAFGGPASRTFAVDPLPPGTYYFQCDVHPQMNGTVVVG